MSVGCANWQPLLAASGVDAEEVHAVLDGRRPSVLSSAPGVLKLDHLDGLVRSARAHGRTGRPPHETLERITVVAGGVSTDSETATYLAELVVGEARLHCSVANAVSNGVVRELGRRLLADRQPEMVERVARMTDDEFWSLLLSAPETATTAFSLRVDPAAWQMHDAPRTQPTDIDVSVTRLYLDLPLVDGNAWSCAPEEFDGLPTLPWHKTVTGATQRRRAEPRQPLGAIAAGIAWRDPVAPSHFLGSETAR